LWYGNDPNTLIFSNDVGYPLNPVEIFQNRLFAWNDSWNFGNAQKDLGGSIPYYALETLLTVITGSVFIGQRIFVIVWFFIILISIYEMVKRLPAFSPKPYMGLLAAIFFGFNHFQLHAWRVLWVSRFSTYAALPIIFLLLAKYFEEKISLTKASILIGFIIFCLNGGGSPPLFGILILMGLIMMFYFVFLSFPKNFGKMVKKSLMIGIFSSLATFLFSFYWIYPYIKLFFSTYGNIISEGGGPMLMLNWADVVSANTSILNLIRLHGLSFWGTGSSPADYQYIYFKNPIFIALSFLLPITGFAAILFSKKEEEKKYILLFTIFALFGLVFSAGSHQPFREFYIFLLKTVPGFPIFRSPVYKFGGLLWFSSAVLISFTLSTVIVKMTKYMKKTLPAKRKPYYLVPLFFVVMILTYNFPFFNGKFFVWNAPLTMMEKIPEYVLNFGKWADKNHGTKRMLLLPALSINWRAEVLRWGYWSPGTVTYLLTRKNAITNDGGLINGEINIVDSLYQSMEKNDGKWNDLTRLLGISEILVKNDFMYDLDWIPSNAPSIYAETIRKNSSFEKINSFGLWDLYKNDHPANDIVYSTTNQILSYSKNTELINILSFLNKAKINSGSNFVIVSAENNELYSEFKQNKTILVSPEPTDNFLYVKKGQLNLPKPKFMPGSPFYFLIEYKEKELINKTSNPDQSVNLYLGLSIKRLGELNEFLNTLTDPASVKNHLDKYLFVTNELLRNTNFLSMEKDATLINRARTMMEEEENYLAAKINAAKDQQIKYLLDNSYKSVHEIVKTFRLKEGLEIESNYLEKDYDDKNIVLLTPQYRWTIPVGGEYEIYISSSSIFGNGENLVFDVDGQQTKTSGFTDHFLAWKNVGTINLSKGIHALAIYTDGNPVHSFKKNDIFFVLKDQKNRIDSSGKLVIIKHNPTKYQVETDNSQPFTLVFNQRFDRDWKLFDVSAEKSKYFKENSLFGKFALFISDNFLNTILRKPISESNHFKVNEFANAWYIDNLKTGSESKVKLVIEYIPQRQIYFGVIVSLLMLLATICIYIWRNIWRKRKK
jgi:hypothetical protein